MKDFYKLLNPLTHSFICWYNEKTHSFWNFHHIRQHAHLPLDELTWNFPQTLKFIQIEHYSCWINRFGGQPQSYFCPFSFFKTIFNHKIYQFQKKKKLNLKIKIAHPTYSKSKQSMEGQKGKWRKSRMWMLNKQRDREWSRGGTYKKPKKVLFLLFLSIVIITKLRPRRL